MQASEVPFFPNDHQLSFLFFILDMSVSCSWWDKCRIHMDSCHCKHACGVVFVVLYLHLCELLLWPSSSSSTTTLIAIERGHRRRQTSSPIPMFEIMSGRWVSEIASGTTTTHIKEKHKDRTWQKTQMQKRNWNLLGGGKGGVTDCHLLMCCAAASLWMLQMIQLFSGV